MVENHSGANIEKVEACMISRCTGKEREYARTSGPDMQTDLLETEDVSSFCEAAFQLERSNHHQYFRRVAADG